MAITIIPEGTYVDASGKYRVMWDDNDGQGIHNNKWPAYFPDSELPARVAEWHKEQTHGWIPKLPFVADSNQTVIVNFINWVRANNPTLTKYNQYLGQQLWYDACSIRTFVWQLAIGLAAHYGVVLSNYTEAEVLNKVKQWLMNTNTAVIEKVCFGQFLNLIV